MGSVVKKGNKYYAVYRFDSKDGEQKQKWERFDTRSAANKRLNEVAYRQDQGTFDEPNRMTVREFLDQYMSMHAKKHWSPSHYTQVVGLFKNYAIPYIGAEQISKLTTYKIDRYYDLLLRSPAVRQMPGKPTAHVSTSIIRHLHTALSAAFSQAKKWGLISENPFVNASPPKHSPAKRDIWTAEAMFDNLSNCEDMLLVLAINLSFCCSLRLGELLGLSWDCTEIEKKSISDECASILVNKQLQRIPRSLLDMLQEDECLFVFPSVNPESKSVLVLKKPKTESSIRRVYLPAALAEMLREWKKLQDAQKRVLGSEYKDYNLILAHDNGTPLESNAIRKKLSKLIRDNQAPKIVFHSFRAASTTYKLRLTGGDVKAVQGDTGHAQAAMVLDTYARILDENRMNTAKLMQQAYYEPRQTETKVTPVLTDELPQDFVKMLSDPNIMTLLRMLQSNQVKP